MMKVFRVVIAASPPVSSERRRPHAVVYVETGEPGPAAEQALERVKEDWGAHAHATVGTWPPAKGYEVVSCAALGPDELYAYQHHRGDFEISDRWRLKRGIDMLEAGEPWWIALGQMRRELDAARDLLAKYLPKEVLETGEPQPGHAHDGDPELEFD